MKKILIFIVVLTAISLISGVAYSKAKGTISGQVTDESGNGLGNVYVGAYDPNDAHWINGSSTDSDGNYSLKVPAGTYKVRFSQPPSEDVTLSPPPNMQSCFRTYVPFNWVRQRSGCRHGQAGI